MSNEGQNDVQTILQNKEISQLLAFASFDIKQNKTAVMKINITEALNILNKATDLVDLRLYGNILSAITRGMNRQMSYVANDLREMVENIRKGQKKAKEAGDKPTKKKKIILPGSSTTTNTSEEGSNSSLEQARHIASKEKITLNEKMTPMQLQELEGSDKSLQGNNNFLQDLSANDQHPGDYESNGSKRKDFMQAAYPDHSSFDFPFEARQFEGGSTPSRFDDHTADKTKQVIDNLDQYYESYKKVGDIIFEEAGKESESEDEGAERARKDRKKRAPEHVDLKARWDYDEKINLDKKPTYHARAHQESFIEKARGALETAKKAGETEIILNLDHFNETFDRADFDHLAEKFSRLATEVQQPLGEISAQKEYESHLPDFYQAFEKYEPEIPADYIDTFQDQPLYVPSQDEPLHDLTNLQEIKSFEKELKKEAQEFEQKKLKESEDTLKKLKELEKAQKAKKKNLTFDTYSVKMNKKSKASAFYDILLLAKQDKVGLKPQSVPFSDIEITIQ